MLEAMLFNRKKNLETAPSAPTGFEALLMHFDSAVGSSSFIDVCGHIVTPVAGIGTASISASNPKFGSTCGLFNGAVLQLDSPISLAGDFTMEAWVCRTAYSSQYSMLFSHGSDDFIFPMIFDWAGGPTRDYFGNYGVGANNSGVPGLILNQYQHLACSRQGSIFRQFINGKTVYTASVAVSTLPIQQLIGWKQLEYSLIGSVNELRILDGLAAYTNDFVPPTGRFGNPGT